MVSYTDMVNRSTKGTHIGMTRHWKATERRPIPGFIGYLAQADGKIYSFHRFGKNKIYWELQPKQVRQTLSANGYLQVHLKRNNGKYAKLNTHIFIALAFHGIPKGGQEVCHNDGNKLNNSATNLRWDTRKANHADKKQHGTQPLGERHYKTSLTDEQVISLRNRFISGGKIKDLAEEFGMTYSGAYQIAKRHTWKHI